MAIDAEIGFTSDVIRDPTRFVGRAEALDDCLKGLNTPTGLIAVYGKRGVGKSSLLRQVQQMAVGDYRLLKKAGLSHKISNSTRTYLTVYYTCDSLIKNADDLFTRLCNDQNDEDGLLRLIPDDGKELVEFSRAKEISSGADLKVVKWGAKGVETSKYARAVENDIVQSFRNYVESIVQHQVKRRMKRDSLLILLDEFDVIEDKAGIGSMIKSLSSPSVKFAICGIGSDLSDLVEDHQSVERLLEEGAVNVGTMNEAEVFSIFRTAELLFENAILFCDDAIKEIFLNSGGYPYLAQLLGKECVNQATRLQASSIDKTIVSMVLGDVKSGKAFPTLERQYQTAIGDSPHRKTLLHLMAAQNYINPYDGAARVLLKDVRGDASDWGVEYIDQNLPRLLEKKYGPILVRSPEKQGVYEFVNPIFQLYVRLRDLQQSISISGVRPL